MSSSQDIETLVRKMERDHESAMAEKDAEIAHQKKCAPQELFDRLQRAEAQRDALLSAVSTIGPARKGQRSLMILCPETVQKIRTAIQQIEGDSHER